MASYTETLSEVTSVVDAASYMFEAVILSLSDNTSLSDAVVRTWTTRRTPSDTIAIGSQPITVQTAQTRLTSDSLTTGDSLGRQYHDVEGVSEVLTTADVLTESSHGVSYDLTTTLSISDSVVILSYGPHRHPTESLTTAATLGRTYGGYRHLNEIHSSSDQLHHTAVYHRAVTDNLSLSETLTRDSRRTRHVIDDIS